MVIENVSCLSSLFRAHPAVEALYRSMDGEANSAGWAPRPPLTGRHVGEWGGGLTPLYLRWEEGRRTKGLLLKLTVVLVSHHLDSPITHEYRGHILFLKFDWLRPNDKSPFSVAVVERAAVNGLGEVAADLRGPWDDYQSAISEAMSAAERWVDSQLP